MSFYDQSGRRHGDWQQEGSHDRNRQRGDAQGGQDMQRLPPGRHPSDWYGSNNPGGLGRGSHPARSDDVHEMRPYPAGRLGARMTNDISNYRRDHDRSDQNDHSMLDDPGSRTRAGDLNRGREHDATEPDYQQWRREQMDALDNDYRAFRQERSQRFGDDFSSWRGNRDRQRAQSPNDVVTGTSSVPASEQSAARQDPKKKRDA